MSKTTKPLPKPGLDSYIKLLSTNPKIELKGATMPYTSLNGNMFTVLTDTGLAMRLPEEARESFIKKYKTTLHTAYGVVMKEYVTVPDKLLKNTKELKKYLDISYQYATTLKAKPTKRKPGK